MPARAGDACRTRTAAQSGRRPSGPVRPARLGPAARSGPTCRLPQSHRHAGSPTDQRLTGGSSAKRSSVGSLPSGATRRLGRAAAHAGRALRRDRQSARRSAGRQPCVRWSRGCGARRAQLPFGTHASRFRPALVQCAQPSSCALAWVHVGPPISSGSRRPAHGFTSRLPHSTWRFHDRQRSGARPVGCGRLLGVGACSVWVRAGCGCVPGVAQAMAAPGRGFRLLVRGRRRPGCLGGCGPWRRVPGAARPCGAVLPGSQRHQH